ncbi:MAG: endonuclease domain-containing protein [Deltaproteobacteria bacterium]|nr:endonuclease domain-containing protein [Deltaproteobacteria bacterium]
MGLIQNNLKLKERRRELRRNQTEAEKLLWARLRNKQIHGIKFFRQFSIGAYVLDFYSPTIKLAVELDGGQHAEKDAQAYDEVRSDYLKAQGIEVMRFWNNDVMQNMEGVLQRIAEKANQTPPDLPFSKEEE